MFWLKPGASLNIRGIPAHQRSVCGIVRVLWKVWVCEVRDFFVFEELLTALRIQRPDKKLHKTAKLPVFLIENTVDSCDHRKNRKNKKHAITLLGARQKLVFSRLFCIFTHSLTRNQCFSNLWFYRKHI
mgnify:CR=1 FL=1